MEFIQLVSGKMLNLNTVTHIFLQYNTIVYELVSGNANKEVYEQFETPEEAQDRYAEVGRLVLI